MDNIFSKAYLAIKQSQDPGMAIELSTQSVLRILKTMTEHKERFADNLREDAVMGLCVETSIGATL